jgi:hypothetical protein
MRMTNILIFCQISEWQGDLYSIQCIEMGNE